MFDHVKMQLSRRLVQIALIYLNINDSYHIFLFLFLKNFFTSKGKDETEFIRDEKFIFLLNRSLMNIVLRLNEKNYFVEILHQEINV